MNPVVGSQDPLFQGPSQAAVKISAGAAAISSVGEGSASKLTHVVDVRIKFLTSCWIEGLNS